MSDTPPMPPPGWYADPSGEHGARWWDGARWTDHVRGDPPADDPPPVPAHLAGDGLPLATSTGGRRVGLILAAILTVGLIATIVVGLRVGGPSGTAARAPLGEVAPGAAVPPPLDPVEVAARTEAAGCEVVVDGAPLEDRSHLDPADAPPPEALYPDRPPHSGQHYASLLPLPEGTPDAPIDERAVLHNLEHGAVVVWFDPGAVGADGRAEIATWRSDRARLGFTSQARGAVFASPMPDLDAPPAVALRAWGVAMDCERFDPMVADAFLVEHWGSHGDAPEANLSPYPEASLRIAERT